MPAKQEQLLTWEYSWVMLDARKGFVRLPGEELVYKSPARTSFAITTPGAYPANRSIAIQSNAGTVHLTNQRVSRPEHFRRKSKARSLDSLPSGGTNTKFPVILRPFTQPP
jgi:WW domain-binding protein 2